MSSTLMTTLGLLICCCLAALPAVEPPRIIIDTDFRGDCDDVGALAVAHRMMDFGETELIGVVTSTTGPSIVAAIDAVNHYYGRPNIPIGLSAVENTISNGGDQYAPTLADTSRYASNQTNASAPDSTALYRQLLHESSQPVTIVVVGYFGAIAHFMNSPADYQGDGIPHTGMELIQSKVHELVLMAGAFEDPNKVVANAMHDYPSTFDVMDHWPTDIIFSGWEVGRAMWTGAGLTNPETNPVAKAYELYRGTTGGAGVIGDRPSYDLAAVIQAVRGEHSNGRRMWQLSAPGTVTISDSYPYSQHVAHADGRHRYQILDSSDKSWVRGVIEELLIAEPGSDLPGDEDPVGLVAAYDLTNGAGSTAVDSSGFSDALDLSLHGDATWVENGIRFSGNGRLQAENASKISQRIKATGRLSIEVWFQPESLAQEGPARLVSLSADSSNRNVTLGHGYWQDANNGMEVRLRTIDSDVNGRPAVQIDDLLDTALQQVVVTYDGGDVSVYRNGSLVTQEVRNASLANWDESFALALGDEVGGGRGWAGTLHAVRIYDRDLSASEIQDSHNSGIAFNDPEPEPSLMTNIQVTSARAVEIGQLAVGELMYTDRTAIYEMVPASLLGREYLLTPNDDKTNTDANYLTITLSEDAMLYVGFDDRHAAPDWLSSWTLTGEKLNDGQDAWVRRLYRKWFPAGTVVLGGNMQSSNSSNYTVIAEASAMPTDPSLPPTLAPGTVTLRGSTSDPDGGNVSVTVDGAPATLSGDQWEITVPVSEGLNSFEVIGSDDEGNQVLQEVLIDWSPAVELGSG